MRVSVIVPHLNIADLLEQAVESVERQTVQDLDLTIFDDGSNVHQRSAACRIFSDASVIRNVWLASWRVRGQGAALNASVRASSGSVLAFLDADDVWAPTKLERQLLVLDADPDVGAVCCHVREFRALRAPDFHATGEPWSARLTSTLVVRKEVFERVGPFREDLGAGMTIEWFSRLEDLGVKLHMHPEVLAYRRIHDRNYGVVRREEAKSEYIQGLRVITERRRK